MFRVLSLTVSPKHELALPPATKTCPPPTPISLAQELQLYETIDCQQEVGFFEGFCINLTAPFVRFALLGNFI